MTAHDSPPQRGRQASSQVWIRKPIVLISAGFAAFAGLVLSGGLLQVHAELAEARRHASFGDFKEARSSISRFLNWFPASAEGRLLAAELFVKDESLGSEEALSTALDHLQQIPDSNKLAGKARIQEARIYLFLLDMPGRAEQRLQKAIQLTPSTAEPYYLRWKLLDLTGRSFYAEEFFKQTYRLSPTEVKPIRLREWYMSQFYPATANPTLDRLMQAASGYVPTGALSELRRFERFQAAEPDAPANTAMIARWYLLNGAPQRSLNLLKDELKTKNAPLQDTTFLMTLINTLHDLGEFEQAWSFYEHWNSEDSYEYHRWTGILQEEFKGDLKHAVQAYDRALRKWPGPADWRLMHRRANCLLRLGQPEVAQQSRARARQVELLMEEDIHRPMRQALANPRSPRTIRAMIDFYEKLDMQTETRYWQEELARVADQH